jgi:long-chain fatty acid transport protein
MTIFKKEEYIMQRTIILLAILSLVVILSPSAFATNGDNLIGVGPTSRSMGGVGIARPLDAIGAVFSNPAAMCFGDYCPSSEVNFSGTLFMPHVDSKITGAGGTISADSEENIYAIPAIGLSTPIGSGASNWRFGLAAYGVSGLGVDYRDSDIDNSSYYDFGAFGQYPLIAGEYTSLQIMKFAPAVAFQPTPRFSVGLALHVDYGILDLRDGSSSSYGFGVQPGMIYNATDHLSLGLTYVSTQPITHKNVSDFDGDGNQDDLKLASPQQIGIGAAYDFLDGKLILETDLKWLNWSDAEGYDDFDWNDQWVFGIGAAFMPMPKLSLRVGYNYGENPVEEHDDFDGSLGPTGPNSINKVQGKTLPTYYYETFRIIGFPAIVEHHVTFGAGYQITENFSAHFGYMHAFENTIKEDGTDLTGQPVTLESSLSEDSLEFGFTWRF